MMDNNIQKMQSGQNGLNRLEVLVNTICFPAPTIKLCALRKVKIQVSQRSGMKTALITANGNVYEIGRVLKDAIYGHVFHAVILQRQMMSDRSDVIAYGSDEGAVLPPHPNNSGNEEIIYTRSNPIQQVAIKVYAKDRIRNFAGKTQEDPSTELSSMQYLGDHPNIMTQIECCEDGDNIYSIMPFCDGGELYDIIEAKGAMKEDLARYYFVQIVHAVGYLQKKGVAHRDMSLENIMFDSSGKCYIIDFGMCLRLPLDDISVRDAMQALISQNKGDGQSCSSSSLPCNADLMDVSSDNRMDLTVTKGEDTQNCLEWSCEDLHNLIAIKIRNHGVCGKRNYIAPEVLDQSPQFEPLRVDIWALGVILFIMLTGVPPVDTATTLDQRYRLICSGHLSSMLEQWGIFLSQEAVDLLNRILKPIPSERLTVQQILKHPWVVGNVAAHSMSTMPRAPP